MGTITDFLLNKYPSHKSILSDPKREHVKHLNLGEANLNSIYARGGRDDRFTRSDWGAAQAYQIISYVEKCIELIATGIASLPLVIKRFDDRPDDVTGKWGGEIVAESGDIKPRHPIFRLLNEYESTKGTNLIFRIAIALTLYDANYLELVRVDENFPVDPHTNPLVGLSWLNPLGVEILDYTGRIDGYTYAPFNNSKPVQYKEYEVVYTHGFNPYDDLRGYPDVLAVMDSLNIDDSIQRAVLAHFRNGIQAQAAVSQKDALSSSGVAGSTLASNREALENARMRSRGVDQVGNFFFVPTGLDVTPLDYPRYDQIIAYVTDTKKRILDQFGVPEVILGNSDIAGYKQGDEDTYRFYVTNLIPRANQIIRYLNIMVLPLFGSKFELDRLELDTSEFDRVSENDLKEAQLTTENLIGGIITINEARKRQGLNELENGDAFMFPTGVTLVPPDKIPNLFLTETGSESNGGSPPTKPPPLPPSIDESDVVEGEIIPPSSQKHFKLMVTELENYEWTEEKALRELSNWYTFIRRKSLKRFKEFVPIYTRGSISDWLMDKLSNHNGDKTVSSYFREARLRITTKAIQATRIDFEDQFVDTTTEFIKGNMTRQQWSIRIRALIRRMSRKAFLDGLFDGGVEEVEITESETIEINNHITRQSTFVTNLGNKIKHGEITLSQAVSKGREWYNKSIDPMYNLGFGSAKANAMVEWVLGPTKKHCRSCKGYNGQRHRFSTFVRIGATPKSDTLACNGFECECRLVPIRGKARGRLVFIKAISTDKEQTYSIIGRFNNISTIIHFQDSLRSILPIETKYIPEEDIHVTLISSNDAFLHEIQESLPLNPAAFSITIDGIDSFDTPDGFAVHLTIRQEGSLVATQAAFAMMAEEKGAHISPFSEIDVYNPHITLCYTNKAVEQIDITPFTLLLNRIEVTNKDGEIIVHNLKAFDESKEKSKKKKE